MPVLAVKSFQCDKCNRKFAWKPELAGKRLRCKCGEAVSVPVTAEVVDQLAVATAIQPAVAARPAPLPPRIPPPPIPLIPEAAMVDGQRSPSTLEHSATADRPPIFLVMVVASVVVGAASIWASWFNAAEWAKAYRGSSPGSSNPWYPGDPQWMQALYFHSLGSIGLAVCLIGAGTILMIRPVLGAKLHLWYAVLKILFILTEIALCVYYFMSVADSGPSQIRFDIPAGTAGLIERVVLQSVYPLAIIAVLKLSPRVKGFLNVRGVDSGEAEI